MTYWALSAYKCCPRNRQTERTLWAGGDTARIFTLMALLRLCCSVLSGRIHGSSLPVHIPLLKLKKPGTVSNNSVFKEKYLEDAVECGSMTWRRGLLQDLPGTAGNSYPFLSLYHLTRDTEHLCHDCKTCSGVPSSIALPLAALCSGPLL
ncbi:hypothetical protein CB1_000123010 [Camelus ferus]|nr:hypothetical protein CB1_000123010 [Camelus ferus]